MRRIILDTDPGIDDALALFLALASPEDVQVEAVTTVNGNVNVDHTTRNALTLLELAGRTDIPVARGSSQPLVRDAIYAAFVHGDNGLGGLTLPAPHAQPVAQHAVDVIIDRIMASPGELSLVPIGPLTNIALAVRREPRIAALVREVVIMGGALRVPGNTTPVAEFNIFVDPHAAHIVFHAGWPIRLVALDVTSRTTISREQFSALAQNSHPVPQAIRQMTNFYFDVFAPAFGASAFHMHDPLCLAAAFQPDLLTWEPAYVDVEIHSPLTMGATVAYFKRLDSRDAPITPNVQAATSVDAERFQHMFLSRIEQHFS
ncbi:MAG TPA: nucleoside hydrolase [Ktedonobacteraceae bacterium]|nr:nucleoside hydrolase [Ktedonobacteraceae bacterium]